MLLRRSAPCVTFEFLADDLDRPGDAGLPAGAEAVDVGAADQAALAPSASARMTSWPERMPPSNRISISEPTASAMAGSIEIDDGAPSSWRPP